MTNAETSVIFNSPLEFLFQHKSDFWLTDRPNLKASHASNQEEELHELMVLTANSISVALIAYDLSKIFT